MQKLCRDNAPCCHDDCRKCANQVYQSYLRLREEMEFTREFIRKHGMEFDLMNEWNRRNT